MRIAVIGAGAMGSIYGGRLSLHNEVWLIDTNSQLIDAINTEGLWIREDGADHVYHPHGTCSSRGMDPADLVILFVKALYSREALAENRSLIGPATYVLTLQNGSGHEELLSEFVPEDHILIGTTQDNGAVAGYGRVRRGGTGITNVGMLTPDREGFLPRLKEAFDDCGFQVRIQPCIRQLIWDKLFTNVSLSAVTGILKCSIGFVARNEYAWAMTRTLIREAVAVARALGLEADEEKITAEVYGVSMNNPDGCTSICADLLGGRRTEVDTISGSVVRAAKRVNVPVPTHEMVVNLIHAMEDLKK